MDWAFLSLAVCWHCLELVWTASCRLVEGMMTSLSLGGIPPAEVEARLAALPDVECAAIIEYVLLPCALALTQRTLGSGATTVPA